MFPSPAIIGSLAAAGGPLYSNFAYVTDSTTFSPSSGLILNSVGSGTALSPRANRVCIIGLVYPVSGIPANTTLINGITATPIIDIGAANAVSISTNICLLIANVGTTQDTASDGGYDIQIIDGNMSSGGILQAIVWNVVMPSITPHGSVTNFNSSSFSTLVLPSVGIPTNGFSVLVGSGASAGLSSVDQGYSATLDGLSSSKTTTSAFSGNVTITWQSSLVGGAVEASFAGDGS